MRAYFTLTRRELGSFFYSWIGYVVIAGAVFLTGLSFVTLMKGLNGVATNVPVTEIFMTSLYLWLILLFSAPVITMRLFALEKYSGTFETLMTTPVGDLAVVLAKFSAALILYSLAWLPLLGFVLVLRYFTHDASFVDPGALGGSFLGIFLIGALYMAMGCFASSLTSNQIVAAMITFALGIGLFILSWAGNRFGTQRGWAVEALNYVCVRTHVEDFSRGIVDSRWVVFYLTASGFFLFLTHRVVQSRRWK
jgi:ABC-2 type transport system permease protein